MVSIASSMSTTTQEQRTVINMYECKSFIPTGLISQEYAI